MPEMAALRRRGCDTCRKKKKKCDMQKPHCRRCINAHLPCGGYASNLVWVHSSKDQKQPQREPTQSDAIRRLSTSQSTKRVSDWPTSPRAGTITPSNLLVGPAATSLIASAREQLYFGHFWSSLLPASCDFSAEAAALSPIGWAHLIPQLYGGERALRLVTMALAMGVLSAENNDMQLRLKALQSYNMAIQMVAGALSRRPRLDGNGLLLAIRLMALFEVALASRNDPRVLVWKEHGQGQEAIFLARGPQAFTSGPAHQLFSDSRVNMALLAIGQRKPSPFSSVEWMTVPWISKPKTPMDQLMDIMMRIPTVLERITQLETLSTYEQAHVKSLAKVGCQELEASLALWAKDFGSEIFRYDHHVAKHPLKPPTSDKQFAFLHLCLVYWFTQMVVWSITGFISVEDEEAMNYADHKRKMYASKSSYALSLLFQRRGGLAQDATGLLCLGIALRYFMVLEPESQKSDESAALEQILDTQVGGVAVEQIIKSMFGGMSPYARKQLGDLKAVDRISWF